MKSKKVFISYSKKDKEMANIICDKLEEKEISCWIAPRNINISENWANQIVFAIESSEYFLIIISENSLKSEEVLKELTLASEMKKKLCAVCINGCEPSNGYRYHLSIAQRLNLNSEELLETINQLEIKILGENHKEFLRTDMPKDGDLQIVSYQELVKNRGMDKAEIARQLVENDRKLYPHIDDDNEGNVSQWETYLSKYPQTFRYMVNDQNKIVGNWSMVSISKDDYRKAKEGQLLESELNIGNTEYFMLGGVFYGYLLNLSVNEEEMSPRNIRLLFESFLEQLEKFAEEDIFFRSWCVNVFLDDHEKRYEALGFKYSCDNKKSGKMYTLNLWPYPQNKIFQKRKKLKAMYERKFQISCYQLHEEMDLDNDKLENIAELIYDTDPYIYPALFKTRANAVELIPELIHRQDKMFSLNNLFVAEYDDEIVGLILWIRGDLEWSKELFIKTSEELGVEISPHLDLVTEQYINSYTRINEDTISIINMCVADHLRNMGIGKQLLESFLKKHSRDNIKLCVLEKNKNALCLYQKQGFQKLKRYRGFSVTEEVMCFEMEKM